MLPLSFAQQRIWFFEQLTPGTANYHIHFAVQLTGALDTDRLLRALSTIVARHESLRTSFRSVHGSPVQQIHEPDRVALPCVDLRALAPDARAASARRHAGQAAQTPFDLTVGPLFRFSLLRLEDDVHVLYATLHHIVSDGTSAAILMRELKALYDVPAGTLPELTVQYADLAAWQREQAATDPALDLQLWYWRQQLGGDLPTLALPTDGPRPAQQHFRGAAHLSTLSRAVTSQLKDFSRERGATLFMTMLSAFQLLVGRLAGQDDVIVGIPVSGRSVPEAEPLIGCFINTLPIRTRTTGAMTFAELLRDVRETALAAYANQDVPFDRLVETLNPVRDRSRSPIFQVLVNMLGADDAWRVPLQDVTAVPLPQLDEPAKFDLTLYIGEIGEAIYLRTVYDRDLFSAARIAECIEQYVQLLSQVVADPTRPIGSYSLRTAAAAARLPDPAAPLAPRWDGHVHERTARLAIEDGARVAVQWGGDVWSYADLESASSDVARRLLAAGVGEEDVVAVYARRRPELVAALLGIWKAGSAFAVLDATYPETRIAGAMRAAQPKAWIATDDRVPAGLLAAAAGCGLGEPLTVGRDRPRGDAAVAPVSGNPDALAYVAFTSGSTGTPKGVLGTMRPVVHFLRWQADSYALGSEDRFSMLSGLAHDPLLRDVFAPLWAGASLHIPEEHDVETGEALVQWLQAQQVTVCHLTPPLARLIGQASGELPALPLRLAFFGGDLLRAGDVSGLRRLAPGVRCVNFYGATETPQAMGAFDVNEEYLSTPAARMPIGRGIEGAQLLVLNAQDVLAGIGEPGEICVRSPYLARGYLSAGSTGCFVQSPFSSEISDRVYRTRDQGRYRPDGTVEWTGRLDSQVKIRGYRIELSDVEAALTAHPSVRQAIVTADGGDVDASLVAYVVSDADCQPDDLRAFVRGLLPEYMVPGALVRLDRVPLTANGKIDLARLRDGVAVERPTKMFTGPATPTEQTLAAIWADLLRVDRIGVHDNFFELGGHSLIATQLVARLQVALGVTLPLRALFDAPTIGALARHLDALQWTLSAATSALTPAATPVTELEL